MTCRGVHPGDAEHVHPHRRPRVLRRVMRCRILHLRGDMRVLFGLFLLLLGQPLAASPSLDAVLIERLRKSPAVAGLAYGVVERDGRITIGTVGQRNIETGEPVTRETLFRSGSSTKMMVAAALLQTMHARSLPVSTTVGAIAPDVAPHLRPLTVHQLLSMSAGLAEAGADSGPLEDGSLAERARTGFRLELFAPPGTVFSYANGGYDLAGHLLERLTGKPFADAMAETLFKPAGLTRSFYRPLEAFSYTASQGHVAGPDGKATVVRPIPDNVPERPSGIAFNTAEDFGRFLYLLLNEGRSPEGTQVLAPSVVAAMTARHNACLRPPSIRLTATASRALWLTAVRSLNMEVE